MIWENGSNFSEIEIKQHMFFVVIAHLFISGPLSLSLSYLGGLLINLSLKNIFLILYTIISDIPSLFSLFFFWYFCHNYLQAHNFIMTPHHFFCYIHPAGKLIWTYSLVLQVVHNVTAECVLGQHVSLLPLLGLACFDLHFHCHLLNQPDIYNYVYISHLLKKNNIISFNIFLKEIWDFFF